MLRRLRNAQTVLTRPSLVLPFLRYFINESFGLKPSRRLFGDIKIRNFINFSEYHSCSRAVSSDELKFISRFGFDSGAIVDIGANLGVYTILLARKNPKSTVYSFEPHPAVFDALTDNIRLNGLRNVKAENLAVAKSNGSVNFVANCHSRATSRMTVSRDAGAIVANVVSLDSYAKAQRFGQISFMKVDVEGFETLVFQGAEELLTRAKVRVIFFEVCPDAARAAGFNPADAATILSNHGYRLHRITCEGELKAVEIEEAEREVVANWVALAPPRADTVKFSSDPSDF
jgi:FkbM family methyltransferase